MKIQYYLRQGKWCQCERSCNSVSGILEAGISVYECKCIDEIKWQGVGIAFKKREDIFKGRQRCNLGTRSIWYLVSGDCIGKGGDHEPILKNVVAHKIVEWDNVNYFVEVSEINGSTQVKNHKGYPNCNCQTIYDIFT